MESRTRDILNSALELPPEEQEALLVALADSLNTPDDEIDRAWAEESRRRWEAIQSGEAGTVSWTDVKRDLIEKFGP
jgi:putative addiction module component (TIGR02574 family)